MNAQRLQFLDRMLRRLGLQLAGCGNIRHQRQMDIDGGAARQVVAELADRLHEGHGLDVAHGAADFADHEIVVFIAVDDEILDLVRDVGNDLHGRAEIVAAAFLVDDVLVDPARGDVVGLGRRTPGEALVVAEVEVGLRAVVGDEHLAVLRRAHRARIDIEIGVQFAQANTVTPCLQQCSESCGRNALAKRRDHAASDEYVSRHGSHRIPLIKRFRYPQNSGSPEKSVDDESIPAKRKPAASWLAAGG